MQQQPWSRPGLNGTAYLTHVTHVACDMPRIQGPRTRNIQEHIHWYDMIHDVLVTVCIYGRIGFSISCHWCQSCQSFTQFTNIHLGDAGCSLAWIESDFAPRVQCFKWPQAVNLSSVLQYFNFNRFDFHPHWKSFYMSSVSWRGGNHFMVSFGFCSFTIMVRSWVCLLACFAAGCFGDEMMQRLHCLALD